MSQAAEISRVAGNIGDIVLEFCNKTLVSTEGQFHAQELRDYVAGHPDTPLVAPASPDRILRLLRQQGRVDYKIVNRRASLYQVIRAAA